MLLVIDVGNTNVVLGIYRQSELVSHWRINARGNQTDDEYGILITSLLQQAGILSQQVTAVIMASVVPPVQATLARAVFRLFAISPLIVGPGLKTGISIRYDNPLEVGADRIVNAVAAYERLRSAAVVVDFGTATTFDLISSRGEYIGGAIAPGLRVASDALFERTAKLPRIELRRPRAVIGRNTVESMQSGLFWGYVALVDGLITRMVGESGFHPVRVMATGGLAGLMAGESTRIEQVDEYLTLTGLRLLYERNC